MLSLPDIPNKALFFFLLSLPASIYIVLLYCSASISVLFYIRAIPKEELGYNTHSTPGHAYLHRKELVHRGMWALSCEPPLSMSSYIDDEDKVLTLIARQTAKSIIIYGSNKRLLRFSNTLPQNPTFLKMWILCFLPHHSLQF